MLGEHKNQCRTPAPCRGCAGLAAVQMVLWLWFLEGPGLNGSSWFTRLRAWWGRDLGVQPTQGGIEALSGGACVSPRTEQDRGC